jgi:hypothetical protein
MDRVAVQNHSRSLGLGFKAWKPWEVNLALFLNDYAELLTGGMQIFNNVSSSAG